MGKECGFITAFFTAALGCVLITPGLIYLTHAYDVKEENVTGEVITANSIYNGIGQGFTYIYGINSTNNICVLQTNTEKYKIHEIITGLYIYSDGTCSAECNDEDCKFKVGLGLTIVGAFVLSISVLSFAYGFRIYLRENGYCVRRNNNKSVLYCGMV
jgi:hypothetical protein